MYLDPTSPGVWRDGRVLVVERGARLPWRCVKCNAPATSEVDKRLVWSPIHPVLRALQSPLMSAALRASFDRSATVSVPLCIKHAARRRMRMIVAAVALPVGLFMLLLAVRQPVFLLAAGVCFATAIVSLLLVRRLVVPARIDERYVRIRRVSRAFLDSLPPLPPNLYF